VADSVVHSSPRVLHVACNLGSGVAAAIASYAALTPEFEHRLLADLDPCCPVDELVTAMTEVTTLPPGRMRRVAHIREVVRRLDPDVVHAHSSFAGAYVRLAVGDRERVVHTPHCYGFHRSDLAGPARAAIWLAEAALSYRGRYVAACSPLEYASACRLPAHRAVTYVPNAAPVLTAVPVQPREGPPVVVAAGRLCAQKAPEVFAAAADLGRRCGLEMRWQWVGGGDAAYVDGLRAAGVEVTGWLPHEAARAHIARAQVYVHTAAWESAPLTVLEAVAAGVPVLAREHPSLQLLGVRPLWTQVPELVDMLASYPSGPALAEAAVAGREVAAAHEPSAQRAALLGLYHTVTHATASSRSAQGSGPRQVLRRTS
jgi:glycosyltransferase involved in cell wall biosynthesis